MSAVAFMNEGTRRMEQFNDIVADIKPLMTTGKGKNQRVTTKACMKISTDRIQIRFILTTIWLGMIRTVTKSIGKYAQR